MLFVKAYTCYRLNVVADILVNCEFSLLNVFFQSNYSELNGKAGIVELEHVESRCVIVRSNRLFPFPFRIFRNSQIQYSLSLIINI